MKLLAAFCAGTALVSAGCTPQNEGPPPTAPASPTASPRPANRGAGPSTTTKYTREHYNKMRARSAAELKSFVKVGMPRTDVTEVLGRATSVSGDGATGKGVISFYRSDGVLEVSFEREKVTGAKIRPDTPQPPAGGPPGGPPGGAPR